MHVALLARSSRARGVPRCTVCGSLALSRWLIVRVYARAKVGWPLPPSVHKRCGSASRIPSYVVC